MGLAEGQRQRDPDRDETELERTDRNLRELLEELRTAMPSVQVLFGFLLTLPFNSRFSQVTPAEEKIYYGTLICTALSAGMLIAPTMHHRLQFRMRRKPRILWWSQRLAVAGLTLFAVSMTSSVFLIGDFVFDSVVAAAGAASVALLIIVLWYVLPRLPQAPEG